MALCLKSAFILGSALKIITLKKLKMTQMDPFFKKKEAKIIAFIRDK